MVKTHTIHIESNQIILKHGRTRKEEEVRQRPVDGHVTHKSALLDRNRRAIGTCRHAA